jgi:hypothetical protein
MQESESKSGEERRVREQATDHMMIEDLVMTYRCILVRVGRCTSELGGILHRLAATCMSRCRAASSKTYLDFSGC